MADLNFVHPPCQVCERNASVGVACVPGIPMSVAYCRECLEQNAHPFVYLRAHIEGALCPALADRWSDPEVIHQGYIDELNTFVDGEYMTLRAALTKHPPTREAMEENERRYEQYCKEHAELPPDPVTE